MNRHHLHWAWLVCLAACGPPVEPDTEAPLELAVASDTSAQTCDVCYICDGIPYNPGTTGCCGGDQLYALQTQGCCGSIVYNRASHSCCNNTVHSNGLRCCEGQVFNPQTHSCCGGEVRDGRRCDGGPHCSDLQIDIAVIRWLRTSVPTREPQERGAMFECVADGQVEATTVTRSFGEDQRWAPSNDPCATRIMIFPRRTIAVAHTHPFLNSILEYRRGVGCNKDKFGAPSQSELRRLNRRNRCFSERDVELFEGNRSHIPSYLKGPEGRVIRKMHHGNFSVAWGEDLPCG